MKLINSSFLIIVFVLTVTVGFGQGTKAKSLTYPENGTAIQTSYSEITGLQATYLQSQVMLEDHFSYSADTIVRTFKYDPAQKKMSVYEYSVLGNQKNATVLTMEDFLDSKGHIIHRKYFGSEGKDEFFEYNVHGNEDTQDLRVGSMLKYKMIAGAKQLVSRIDYEYDEFGRKEKEVVYDSEGRLEAMISFVYDAGGNLISEEEMVIGTGATYNDDAVKLAELSFEYNATYTQVTEHCTGCWSNSETIISRYEF